MQKQPIDLTLVIPCFNEAAGIQHTLATVQQYLQQTLPGLLTEILVINDGSTDDTLAALEKAKAHYSNVAVISFPVNKGRGEAIKQGIRASKGEYLIMLDADLTYDVQHIGDIMSEFQRHPKTDVVVVSPYMKGGVVSGVPYNRLFVSRCANWLLGGFFQNKLSTVTCVVRGYRGDLIRRIHLTESNKELHLEILRKLSIYGANIQEIPGRLIWKTTKEGPRRSNNLKTVNSAQKHFLYALMVRPTRYFKYLAIILLFVGFYEVVAIGNRIFSFMDFSTGLSWNALLKHALTQAYAYSPYSFLFMTVSLILGFQVLSVLIILQTMKLQQEETLRHLLAMLETAQPIIPETAVPSEAPLLSIIKR